MDNEQMLVRRLIEDLQAEDGDALSRQLDGSDEYGVWSGKEKSPEKIGDYFAKTFAKARAISRAVDEISGETVLTYAVAQKSHRLIKILLSYHVDINAQRRDGKTPLGVAYGNDDVDIVKLLLLRGADPRRVNLNDQALYPNNSAAYILISDRLYEHERILLAIQKLLEAASANSIAAELRDALRRGALVNSTGPALPTNLVVRNCQTRSELNTTLSNGAEIGYADALRNFANFQQSETLVTSVITNKNKYEIYLSVDLLQFIGVVKSEFKHD